MTAPHPQQDRAPALERASGLVIDVVTGSGHGPTKLAAFDAALRAAGVANFNLIRLSSVIPPGSEVRVRSGPGVPPAGTWGDRLYVVMADLRVEHPGEEAFAGIGWVQDSEGKGLFVEHTGHTRREVETLIESSLESIAAGRSERFGAPRHVVAGTSVEDRPACALACAVYEAAGWATGATPGEIRLP